MLIYFILNGENIPININNIVDRDISTILYGINKIENTQNISRENLKNPIVYKDKNNLFTSNNNYVYSSEYKEITMDYISSSIIYTYSNLKKLSEKSFPNGLNKLRKKKVRRYSIIQELLINDTVLNIFENNLGLYQKFINKNNTRLNRDIVIILDDGFNYIFNKKEYSYFDYDMFKLFLEEDPNISVREFIKKYKQNKDIFRIFNNIYNSGGFCVSTDLNKEIIFNNLNNISENSDGLSESLFLSNIFFRDTANDDLAQTFNNQKNSDIFMALKFNVMHSMYCFDFEEITDNIEELTILNSFREYQVNKILELDSIISTDILILMDLYNIPLSEIVSNLHG